jgi:hypothetical protein
MTRVKVNDRVIMAGKEPPSANHFDLVRFHLKSYNSHKRIGLGKSALKALGKVDRRIYVAFCAQKIRRLQSSS